jgi:hypothetical protein
LKQIASGRRAAALASAIDVRRHQQPGRLTVIRRRCAFVQMLRTNVRKTPAISRAPYYYRDDRINRYA